MSSKFMYEIEIRHRGLNKYRHIKGSDKYIVEQKAHMQQLAWDEMWEKKLLAEGKRVEKEEKNRSREENKELALSRTAEAKNEISEIKNILNPDSQQPHQQFVGIPAISDYGVLIPEVLAHPRARIML